MDGHWPYPWTWLQKLECLKFHHLYLKKMELGSRNRRLTSVTGGAAVGPGGGSLLFLTSDRPLLSILAEEKTLIFSVILMVTMAMMMMTMTKLTLNIVAFPPWLMVWS